MRQSCFNLWMNGVVVCYAIVQFLAWSKLRLQGSTSWGASRAWRKMWARCEWWSLLLRASLILLKQRSLMFWCSSAFQDCWWLNGIAQPLDGPPRLLTSFVSRISLIRSPIWAIWVAQMVPHSWDDITPSRGETRRINYEKPWFNFLHWTCELNENSLPNWWVNLLHGGPITSKQNNLLICLCRLCKTRRWWDVLWRCNLVEFIYQ